MSAREIIADTQIVVPIGNANVSGRIGERFADRALARLEAAGYRLTPPGSLDRETIEKCAALLDKRTAQLAGTEPDIAAVLCERARKIRALGAEK